MRRVLRLLPSALLLAGCTEPLLAPPEGKTLVRGPACHGRGPDEWLAGRWEATKMSLTFRRAGERFAWRFERGSGLVSERWGLKAPATAEGAVVRVGGCEIALEGVYTSYGESNRAVNTPLVFRLTHDGGRILLGIGEGYGKEIFRIMFRRAE